VPRSKFKTPAIPELDAAVQAQLLALREQAQLLGLLTGSVRAGLGPLEEFPPSGTVDLIGALGHLEHAGTPGSDPLHAFATVVPRFVLDTQRVVSEFGEVRADHPA
jgi:hypothetical protein